MTTYPVRSRGRHSCSNNEPREVSRSHSSDEVSVMEMERRAEQFKSQMDSQKYASISDAEGSSEDVTE